MKLLLPVRVDPCRGRYIVQPLAQLLGQMQIDCGQVFKYVFGQSCAEGHRRNSGLAQRSCQCDLDWSGAQFFSHTAQYLHNGVRLGESMGEKFRSARRPGSRTSYQACTFRSSNHLRVGSRQSGHLIRGSHRSNLMLDVTCRQRVVHLVAGQSRPVCVPTDSPSPLQIASTELACADVADLPLTYEVEGTQCFVKRLQRVSVVQLEKIDMLTSKASQTSFDRPHDV